MTTLSIPIDAEFNHYLEASARLRGVSVTRLGYAIMQHVLRDQLILSILDDGDAPSEKTAYKQRGPGRPRTIDVPPKDSLFDATVRRPVVQHKQRHGRASTFNPSDGLRRPQQKTRSQLEAELRAAVENTARIPVE